MSDTPIFDRWNSEFGEGRYDELRRPFTGTESAYSHDRMFGKLNLTPMFSVPKPDPEFLEKVWEFARDSARSVTSGPLFVVDQMARKLLERTEDNVVTLHTVANPGAAQPYFQGPKADVGWVDEVSSGLTDTAPMPLVEFKTGHLPENLAEKQFDEYQQMLSADRKKMEYFGQRALDEETQRKVREKLCDVMDIDEIVVDVNPDPKPLTASFEDVRRRIATLQGLDPEGAEKAVQSYNEAHQQTDNGVNAASDSKPSVRPLWVIDDQE